MEELVIDNVNYEIDKFFITGVKDSPHINLLLILYKYRKYTSEKNLLAYIPGIDKLIEKLKNSCLCT